MIAIVKFFVERKLLANFLMFVLAFLGVFSIYILKKQTLPNSKVDIALITTVYPGAAPQDVEQNVTRLIEDELKGVSGLKKYMSFSMENTSVIQVEIDPDSGDTSKIVEDIQKAVDRVTDLPKEILYKPEVYEIDSANFPIINVGISGEASYEIKRELAEALEKKIKLINGIKEIEKVGFRDKEIHIDVNPKQLHSKYIALNDIAFALANRNIRSTGGSLESFTSQKDIVTIAEFDSIDDIQNVIIRANYTGKNIRIKDVANVKYGYEKETRRSRFNGKSGISLIVVKKAAADQITVTENIKKLLEKENKHLPAGITLTSVNDTSFIVKNRLAVITQNAFMGFVLVLLALFVFLNLRVAFWTSIAIPVAVFFTFILMHTFGIDITVISLAAIIMVMGMLVDDAIIVSENIYRHKLMGKSPMQASLEGTQEVMWPVICTVATSIVAFIPLIFLKGMMGKFIFAIPVVVAASLFGSLVDSFTILPSHIATVKVDKTQSGIREKAFDNLKNLYAKVLTFCLKFRYLVVGLFIILLIFSMGMARKHLGFRLFPEDAAQAFFIKIKTAPESTHNATEEVIKVYEKAILNLSKEELDSIAVEVGNSSEWGQAQGVGFANKAIISVYLTPSNERKRLGREIMESLRKEIIPPKIVQKVTWELVSGGPPAGKPVEINVICNKKEKKEKITKEIYEFIQTIPGVYDIERNDDDKFEHIRLNLNYEKLSTLALTVADVASTIRTAYDGIDATEIIKDNEAIDINLRFAKEFREDMTHLKSLRVRNAIGKLIPISKFTSIDKEMDSRLLYHYNGDAAVVISSELDQKKTNNMKASKMILAKFSPVIDKDPDIQIIIGGEAAESTKTIHDLIKTFLTAIFAIFTILLILFNSLSQPLLVMAAIPFGIIGVIFTLIFHGHNASFMAGIGTIGLCGVIVNDSLVMVSFINNLMKKYDYGKLKSVRAIIVEGAKLRLRPIILTTLTTVAGLFPTAYGLGGSDVYIQRLVLPIAWGLVFATLLTLILIPCFYNIDRDVKRIFVRIFLKKQRQI
ncbi:MAG: efflux RND transporter permease subunit [Pseudomonadota bacterium]